MTTKPIVAAGIASAAALALGTVLWSSGHVLLGILAFLGSAPCAFAAWLLTTDDT